MPRTPTRKRKRDCCTICGQVFPTKTLFDAESYEQLVLSHMMKCSVSPAAMDPRKVAASAMDPRKVPAAPDIEHAPPAKTEARNDHRKPAARKFAPPRRKFPICRRTLPVSSPSGDKLPVAKKTAAKEALPEKMNTSVSSSTTLDDCTGEISPLKDGKPAALWNLEVVQQESNGDSIGRASRLPGTTDTSIVFELSKHTGSGTYLGEAPHDTNSTEVITVDSNHFLSKTWWREKSKTKKSRVSIPFNLAHFLQVSNPNDNNNAAAATTDAERSPFKAKLRPRNGRVEITCPVCKKTLNKLSGAALTEDQMASHVKRCLRKLLSETDPASSQSSSGDDSEKKKMASDLAVVAALSRPRHQGNDLLTTAEQEKAMDARKGRRAAEFAARKASLYFLTNGTEKAILDRWALGEGPGAFRNPT